jgi:hypothetical protein
MEAQMKKFMMSGLLSIFMLMIPNAYASELPPPLKPERLGAGTFEIGMNAGGSSVGWWGYRGESPVGFEAYIGNGPPGYLVNLSPSIGYFVSKGFELKAGISTNLYFGSLESIPNLFGFQFGVSYILDFGSAVSLYFGGSIGMNFLIPDSGSIQKSLALTLPVGILLHLNQNVAIDIGILGRYHYSLETGNDDWGDVLLPTIGIRAFI